jgi:ankyrin repeat protein
MTLARKPPLSVLAVLAALALALPTPPSLLAAAKAGDANTLAALLSALPATGPHLSPALAAALAGWRSAHSAAWPPPPAGQWGSAFQALLRAGAALPPAEACAPFFDALAFHDPQALGVFFNFSSTPQLATCLAARRGAGGGTLLHHACRNPSPRASVPLFRLRREGGTGAAQRALDLGLADGVPPAWDGGAGGAAVLTAAALEQAMGGAELEPLGGALARAATATAAAALAASDAAGATPLDTACAEGRIGAVQWLLARGEDYPLPPASAAATPGGQRACAHAAAARGDGALLRALLALPHSRALLSAPDSQGRTPCAVALQLGPLLGGEALHTLRNAGACSGVAAAGGGEGRCPLGLGVASRGPLDTPPTFSACQHSSAGWSLVSAQVLHSLGLPGRLLACSSGRGSSSDSSSDSSIGSSESPRRRQQRRASTLAGGQWCPIDVLDYSTALAPSANARGALFHHYLQYGRPFLLTGAFSPPDAVPGEGSSCAPSFGASACQAAPSLGSNATATSNSSGSGSSNSSSGGAQVHALTRSALLAEAGSAWVAHGAVPLEAAYSGSASGAQRRRVTLAEFVEAHMGARAPAAGPGANATAPQYVFDTRVLWAPRGKGGALGDAASALHSLLVSAGGAGPWGGGQGPPSPAAVKQLAVGPPLSGAPPHLHRAAVNTLLAGVKLWAVWPPAAAFFADGVTAGQWWQGHLNGSSAVAGGHFLFLQGPGEAVYLPPLWGHAVLNLADSVGVAFE